jgi:elongation factor P
MYESSDLRKGLKIQIDGEPYIVTHFDFSKPGKGQAIYKCRLKNMLTGSNLEKSYRSGEKFAPADLVSRQMEYLYYDGQSYCFMDPETYENVFADETVISENKNFLVENTRADLLFYGERVIDITLPPTVVLIVTDSPPGVRGDTATNVTKPATVQTGYEVQVPLFINEGDKVRIDTRTGEYTERVND